MSTGPSEEELLRRAKRLEWMTTAWNLGEVFVTVSLGLAAGSLALVAFGLDSLIEVFASSVVLWHMRDGAATSTARTALALRLIAGAFFVLAAYLLVASIRSIVIGASPEGSPLGVAYLAVTAVVMFTLASIKHRTAAGLAHGPLHAEAHMTYLDAVLCVCILVALGANLAFGWAWADGLAALVIAGFAIRAGWASRQEAASL